MPLCAQASKQIADLTRMSLKKVKKNLRNPSLAHRPILKETLPVSSDTTLLSSVCYGVWSHNRGATWSLEIEKITEDKRERKKFMEALIRQVQQEGCLSHRQLYGAPVVTSKGSL